MAFATILVFHFLLLAPVLIYSSHHVEDPESVVQEVQKYVIPPSPFKYSWPNLYLSYFTTNPIVGNQGVFFFLV